MLKPPILSTINPSNWLKTAVQIGIYLSSVCLIQAVSGTSSSLATTPPHPDSIHPSSIAQTPSEDLDLDPEIIEESPVLQRWLEEIPDVRSDIRHDPSFRTRLRLGYTSFPSTDNASGITIAIEDIFIGQTGLTASADYQTAFERDDRTSYGANLRYYVLPLGNRINVAPVIGYRSVEAEEYATDGVDLGIRLLLVPSRTGAADISFTQTWVIPGTDETVSLSTLSFAYAVTHHLRLATDLQLQHASQATDSRVGVGMEWMF